MLKMISSRYMAMLRETRTPFYFYNMELLQKTLEIVKQAADSRNYVIHYAVKANANERILKTIARYGYGADCVSGNEVKAAISAGFNPRDIVFAGVGKSDQEIDYALRNNIFCFHCESVQELEVIDRIASIQGKRALVALRVNPNVSANTHAHITTGTPGNKFGLSPSELEQALELIPSLNNLRLIGFHFHIGSQITSMEVFEQLAHRVNELQAQFFANTPMPYLNVGGGLGVNYVNPEEQPIPLFEEYFTTFQKNITSIPGQRVHFELGRSIVAQCGSLITKVLYVKGDDSKKFVVVDAGMTDLLRPALYNAVHKIVNLNSQSITEEYDVVGPICETTDCFARSIKLPETSRGDLLSILSAGAYGEVMSSRYNLREKPLALFSNNLKPSPNFAV